MVGFGIWDYVVFGGMLLISSGIGLYYGFTGGKQKTIGEYLFGDRTMGSLTVAFSLMASFMSAITLLGVTQENYYFGTQFVVINIAYIIGTPICAYLYLPVFFQLQAASAYEYLEKRFGKTTRVVASLAFSLQMILYMGIVLYAPALALSAVTGLTFRGSILAVGLVCTFYSTLGGIKAVLVTDVFQSLLMFAAIYAVIICGLIKIGGVGDILRIANEHGRIEFFNFDPDPTVRHSVWTQIIGGLFIYCSLYGVNHAQVQRLLTVGNLQRSQRSLWIQWPILTLLSLSTSFAGLVMFAFYKDCDPVSAKRIAKGDQLLPLFVVDTMSHLPGLSGLFVSGIFSGSLSTVSSAINSLAAVTLEDYIKPIFEVENSSTIILKSLAIFYGIACIGLAFMAELLGPGVLQASLTIFGVVGGPLLGLFTLGMAFRRANQIGAISGLISSLGFLIWMGFGQPRPRPQTLSTSVQECDNLSFINISANTTALHQEPEDYFFLYRISYAWNAVIGFLLCLIIGLVVSEIAQKLNSNPSTPKTLDPNLFMPFIRRRMLQELIHRKDYDQTETLELNRRCRHKGANPPCGMRFLSDLTVWLALMVLVTAHLPEDNGDDEAQVESEDFEGPSVTSEHVKSEDDVIYITPETHPDVFFAEHFDDEAYFSKKWTKSQAKKDGTDAAIAKYDGEWSLETATKDPLNGDMGLVMKSKAKHAAISAKLRKPFQFHSKPLVIQYELNFQNGQDCGGGYIKLLSHSKDMDLRYFTDKTPYTIMFGPDKCGSDAKLHFIFRHVNPLNKTVEEKHCKKLDTKERTLFEEFFKDKRPHLYRLILNPDNTFEISVDYKLFNHGTLMDHFEPPVNPPAEIDDPMDEKPKDWDEREKIPDPDSVKPADWDESQPKQIQDESATMPDGWLEDEPDMIPDSTAEKPDDWDDDLDGEWEAPLVNNPICESAPGCGKWVQPMIENPRYKGKWFPALINNPNYKGKWKPRKIPNPDYFHDPEPFKMTSIGAVGIELWSMSDDIYFDNLLITDSLDIAKEWSADTFDLKVQKLDASDAGTIRRIINYSNRNPWLYAVYLVVVGLPLVLIVTFCCSGSGDSSDKDIPTEGGKNQLNPKKTDEVQDDDQPEDEDRGDNDEDQEEAQEGEEEEEEEEEEEPEEVTRRSTRKRRARKE
ncbi:hypothetical protein TCAL_03416 [Tigriopus californicus]|uniref:Uncharacterized protein n=2 Tax=Tigriopus californicus TaxID=6832 RepID=A0A553P211_TIGCA|nr:hypothetical protein TCAL_03416 [Tigriopus californicus]